MVGQAIIAMGDLIDMVKQVSNMNVVIDDPVEEIKTPLDSFQIFDKNKAEMIEKEVNNIHDDVPIHIEVEHIEFIIPVL